MLSSKECHVWNRKELSETPAYGSITSLPNRLAWALILSGHDKMKGRDRQPD